MMKATTWMTKKNTEPIEQMVQKDSRAGRGQVPGAVRRDDETVLMLVRGKSEGVVNGA